MNKDFKRILIIEDNPFDMLVLNTLLKDHFELSLATNGSDALLLLKQSLFDIILMDINLGDAHLDGTTIIKMIRDDVNYKTTKIAAVSAYIKANNNYFDLGFDEVFEKPINKDDLFNFIDKN